MSSIIKISRRQWFIAYNDTFYYFPKESLAIEFYNKIVGKIK